LHFADEHPSGQTCPQVPQLLPSVCSFTHAPLQTRLLQRKLHPIDVHVGAALAGAEVHCVAHVPQCAVVLSGVSQPAALVQSPNPSLQEATEHDPVAQLATAFGKLHGTAQPPQFALVLVGVSQPSVSFAAGAQLANPAAHAVAGTTQLPALH
jgi:hypothetical protein